MITRSDLMLVGLLRKAAVFTGAERPGTAIEHRANRDGYTHYFPVAASKFTDSGISLALRTSLRRAPFHIAFEQIHVPRHCKHFYSPYRSRHGCRISNPRSVMFISEIERSGLSRLLQGGTRDVRRMSLTAVGFVACSVRKRPFVQLINVLHRGNWIRFL
jgi:hypothetical protein